MANIRTIEFEEASGRLKEIYDDLIAKRGKLADVHRIQSLRPESIVKHMDLYMEIMFSKSELSRAEREMIAVIVSKCNQCVYCQSHHGEALNFYWKNDAKVEQLKNDFQKVALSKREEKLCIFAKNLSLEPTNNPAFIEELKNVGLSDSGILDATLVISYFNFVNRIVLALGVELEVDSGKGYEY